MAGSLEPQVARAREGLTRTASGTAEATVFARGAPRVDRYSAASANGMAITWCELDEGFRNASCHGGAYTIPALLAEAEAQGRTVEEVLRALALAYEVTTRFALAFPFPVFNVHPHAAFAPIGAAAATSLVRRHDAKTMLDAVTGAASMSFAGPFDTAVEGPLVRNAWTSAGAWLGLRAADWAEAGIGGGAVTPYDVFVGSFSTRAVPEALVDGLGTAWSVANGYHKIFACCGYSHSAVEATLELLGRLRERKVDDIAEILVETGPGGQALTTVEPETVLAAKFSIPHAIAATARLGTAGARAFTFDKLDDDGIAKLRRRVRLAPYQDLQAVAEGPSGARDHALRGRRRDVRRLRERARRRRSALRRADAPLEARRERGRRLPRGAGHPGPRHSRRCRARRPAVARGRGRHGEVVTLARELVGALRAAVAGAVARGRRARRAAASARRSGRSAN